MALTRLVRSLIFSGLIAILFSGTGRGAETFRVATYNLENYLEAPAGTRPRALAKMAAGRPGAYHNSEITCVISML